MPVYLALPARVCATLSFYLHNKAITVLPYDKRQLAYICGSDSAVAGRVDWRATFTDISYGDGEKVTKRCFVVPHFPPPHYFLPTG